MCMGSEWCGVFSVEYGFCAWVVLVAWNDYCNSTIWRRNSITLQCTLLFHKIIAIFCHFLFKKCIYAFLALTKFFVRRLLKSENYGSSRHTCPVIWLLKREHRVHEKTYSQSHISVSRECHCSVYGFLSIDIFRLWSLSWGIQSDNILEMVITLLTGLVSSVDSV